MPVAYINQLNTSYIAHSSYSRGSLVMFSLYSNIWVRITYMFIILSPTLLLDSRLMLSPSDSSLSLSLLADRRRE